MSCLDLWVTGIWDPAYWHVPTRSLPRGRALPKDQNALLLRILQPPFRKSRVVIKWLQFSDALLAGSQHNASLLLWSLYSPPLEETRPGAFLLRYTLGSTPDHGGKTGERLNGRRRTHSNGIGRTSPIRGYDVSLYEGIQLIPSIPP